MFHPTLDEYASARFVWPCNNRCREYSNQEAHSNAPFCFFEWFFVCVSALKSRIFAEQADSPIRQSSWSVCQQYKYHRPVDQRYALPWSNQTRRDWLWCLEYPWLCIQLAYSPMVHSRTETHPGGSRARTLHNPLQAEGWCSSRTLDGRLLWHGLFACWKVHIFVSWWGLDRRRRHTHCAYKLVVVFLSKNTNKWAKYFKIFNCSILNLASFWFWFWFVCFTLFS